jgi:glutamate-ammonia-ligase adenylyltransferase
MPPHPPTPSSAASEREEAGTERNEGPAGRPTRPAFIVSTRALLSPAAVAVLDGLPWEDPVRALRLLEALQRRAGPPPVAGPFLDCVLEALPEAPDPEMALLNLERWASRLATPAGAFALLQEDPRLLHDLLALFGGSRYLADILARDSWLYSLFTESAESPPAEHYDAEVAAALRALRRPDARRDALRRVKRREFLRIGWRDLARQAPFPEVVAEISGLADALIRGALQLAHEEVDGSFQTAARQVRFTVLALGKLGAQELNYSSDVDLVFVMDAPNPADEAVRRYATRLAETVIQVLAKDTAEGRCFRVDMRLRPEGRSGWLVRSFHAYREYYDRWAETWERQALIKARPVAGDQELGERFLHLIRPVTYRPSQGAAVIEDVREMRAAVEARLAAAGEMERHVKEGRGTIRDVEFTLQLMQLLFGADCPALQVRDTWTLLARMETEQLLSPPEAATFRDGYRFFREVEHRLQLMNDLPIRLIPTEARELRRLARTMGFAEAEEFAEAVNRHREAVRDLAENLLGRLGVQAQAVGRLRGALALAHSAEGVAALRPEVADFPDPEAALKSLVRLAVGPPGFPHPSSTRRLFAELAEPLLKACRATADPSAALEGLDQFAERKLLYRALFQTLAEQPETLASLAGCAGSAPRVWRALLRYPELADVVADPAQVAEVKDSAAFTLELEARLEAAPSHERRLAALRRYKLREWARLAARHVLTSPPPAVETAEWSDLADVLLRGALETALTRLKDEGLWSGEDAGAFAVFALGRFGGRDLHFSSDLDLLYVFGSGDRNQQDYERLARALNEAVQQVTEDGPLFELDLRLRPEGRQGFSVASLAAARRYYGEGGRGETWEFQMLTRLRFVTGDPETAREFQAAVTPRVFRDPMPVEWRDQIRAMKHRIETERVTDALRPRHLKLGPGGLSDIEFAVQYLQLAHGGANPALRVPATLPAAAALTAAGILAEEDRGALEAAFAFLTRTRQSLALLRLEGSTDVLPDPGDEPRQALALARALGFPDPHALLAAHAEVTAPVRRVFLRAIEG